MTHAVPNHPERTGDETFTWHVPDGWQQGRGAFGGLVLSTLARAAREVVDRPDAPLRTLTASMPGPVLAGDAEIGAHAQRAGSRVVSAESWVSQRPEGSDAYEMLAHATATFGAKRDVKDRWTDIEPPVAPPWREVEPMPDAPGMRPTFTQHVEMRVVDGFPFSGHTRRETMGWVRLKDRPKEPDELDLILLIDSWWPAALAVMDTPRPGATLTFSMQVVGDWEGLDPDAPVLFRGTSPVGRDGYVLEHRELWGEDGRLLAYNHQTVAIIK